ncbi:carbohydrate ABC transporter permease [Actinomadura rugatobispora]|uniref:Carbohydrate ABC transporter permease n=1 Tax=Actinomadura rugatobispora TaxID=1994 RepID=A0ABW1A824_9ACTN|nr:sugar ABC transporter permease [Actinomadura rugatobispora]
MAGRAETPGRFPRLPTPYLLLVPSALFMLALFAWPLVQGVATALRDPSTGTGFGLESFRRMVEDPAFWPAVRNTVLLIVIVLPVQFALAIAMALLLRERPRLSGLYFYLWAVPLAISDLAAGLVWLAVFADQGYLNSAIEALGGTGHGWLSYRNPGTMLLAVVLAELWRATSLVFVILVGGLSVIPKEYDEAAQVFGATPWQRLRHVTLPLLRPSIQVALILRTILALQAFAVAQALTGRGFPLLIGETYEWYVNLQNPYVAAAVGLVILVVSMFTAVVYLRTLRQPDVVRGAR